jgi:hypothetical protein
MPVPKCKINEIIQRDFRNINRMRKLDMEFN